VPWHALILTWFAVLVMPKDPSAFTPSQAQPLPKRPAAAALNFSFMVSKLPKALSMAACMRKRVCVCVFVCVYVCV